MAIDIKIVDGTGSGNRAKVNDGGYIFTQNSNLPPVDDNNSQSILRQFLTLNNDGITTDMIVDGSITPQLFTINAIPEKDIYITSLSILVQGNALTLGNDFAGSDVAGNPLPTNGMRIYYEDENGEINVGTDLTTNFSFIRLSQGNVAFGDDTTAFIKTDGVPTIFPTLNFNKVFGFTSGLRLLRGTNNKLVLEVNDDLPNIVNTNGAFNIIVNGFTLK